MVISPHLLFLFLLKKKDFPPPPLGSYKTNKGLRKIVRALNLQVLREQIHQDNQAPIPKLLAQEIQLLPRVEPYIHLIRQHRPIQLIARRHLRNMRLKFRLKKHLHPGAHARLVRKLALKDVVDAKHEVEPADGVLARLALRLVDVFDEFLKDVFAAAVALVAVADELHDIHVVEKGGGVARGIGLKRGGHEIG